MKDYKTIRGMIDGNKAKIENLNNKLLGLLRTDETSAAIAAKDLEKFRAIKADIAKTEDEQKQLSRSIYNLTLVNKVLENNLVCAIYESAMPVIMSAYAPFEGKAYGEKTREKIYNAVKAAGFSVYISGYSREDTMNIRVLGPDGYYDYRFPEVTIYTDYEKPFITPDNKINVAGADTRINAKYIEDIADYIINLDSAYVDYIAAIEKAKKAESALNNLLPANIDNFHYIQDCNRQLVRT